MSKELHERISEATDQLVTAQQVGKKVKLTYPALAAHAGVSLSTVNLPEYTEICKRLKAAKTKRPQTGTNEDALEWRRKFYQLQAEKAVSEKALKANLEEARETIERLVQAAQVSVLKTEV